MRNRERSDHGEGKRAAKESEAKLLKMGKGKCLQVLDVIGHHVIEGMSKGC